MQTYSFCLKHIFLSKSICVNYFLRDKLDWVGFCLINIGVIVRNINNFLLEIKNPFTIEGHYFMIFINFSFFSYVWLFPKFLIPSLFSERDIHMETYLPDGNKADMWLSFSSTDSPICSYGIHWWKQLERWGVHKVNYKLLYLWGCCGQESKMYYSILNYILTFRNKF